MSESRLNQRYHRGGGQTELSPEDLEMESISQRGGRRDRWEEVGLEQRGSSGGRAAKGSNDRYFSQPDLMDKASPTNKTPIPQGAFYYMLNCYRGDITSISKPSRSNHH